jgi:hypothetical protein
MKPVGNYHKEELIDLYSTLFSYDTEPKEARLDLTRN